LTDRRTGHPIVAFLLLLSRSSVCFSIAVAKVGTFLKLANDSMIFFQRICDFSQGDVYFCLIFSSICALIFYKKSSLW
ncbi:hypothetical protein, partial [Bacteroides caecimuris]|uniref:hypothetical protein n=1 Tax=Bacteroides caecimuris TaxID=1796613 RepID=UPI00266535A2